MSHNTKELQKETKKTESSKKNRCAFSSASISIGEFCKYHPQTDRKSRSIGRNCRIVCFHKKLSVYLLSVMILIQIMTAAMTINQSTQDTCLVPDQRLFMSSKYERRYNWLYYSAAKGGYCCKICELFAQESDNILIKGTTLGFFFEHPQQMVNQIVNQISEFAYESVKSKKLNKRNT